jgi:hypothetical protein
MSTTSEDGNEDAANDLEAHGGEDEHEGEDERETVTYELGSWSAQARTMLEQLLTGEAIPRAWESTDLVVPAAFESRVDDLVDEVVAADQPVLDPDAEKVAYEVAGWTPDQLAMLTDALGREEIAYDFNIDGDLLVAALDEARVEAVLDELEAEGDVGEPVNGEPTDGEPTDGDADAGDADDDDDDRADSDDDGVGGEEDALETNDILSDLFVACDRLQHNPEDADGVLGAVSAAERLAGRPLPYGYEPRVWESLLHEAAALKDALEGDEAGDEELAEQAKALRNRLRDYV